MSGGMSGTGLVDREGVGLGKVGVGVSGLLLSGTACAGGDGGGGGGVAGGGGVGWGVVVGWGWGVEGVMVVMGVEGVTVGLHCRLRRGLVERWLDFFWKLLALALVLAEWLEVQWAVAWVQWSGVRRSRNVSRGGNGG